MLSRPCFSNDPPLPHFLSQESLAESIVDLVRATMQEILSLQVDPSASNMTSQIGSKVQWRRPAGETVQPAGQLFLEGGSWETLLCASSRALSGSIKVSGTYCPPYFPNLPGFECVLGSA